MSRLNLNWELEWRDERNEYAHQYLNTIPFKPTNDELDMIGKYILWGKDRETGLNGRQEGLELETKAGTWDNTQVESYEALLESPAFNEASFRRPEDPPTKAIRDTFSRSEARALAPQSILNDLELIWRAIDEAELTIAYYDLAHQKRTSPIRQPLLDRFEEEERLACEQKASQLQPYAYLKLRHQLVDLRRQQFIYRDVYKPAALISSSEANLEEEVPPTFGDEIEVAPMGLWRPAMMGKIYPMENGEAIWPNPAWFGEAELKEVDKWCWRKPHQGGWIIDLTDADQWYQLLGNWEILEAEREEGEDSTKSFIRVVEYLVSLAPMEPVHRRILELKVGKKGNQEIADRINREFGKGYKPNYISTLYCKKCIEVLAQTARDHKEVMENIFFAENFKKCKDCGRVLLLGDRNFVKRHRSNDGYSPRCKACEKIKRKGGNREV